MNINFEHIMCILSSYYLNLNIFDVICARNFVIEFVSQSYRNFDFDCIKLVIMILSHNYYFEMEFFSMDFKTIVVFPLRKIVRNKSGWSLPKWQTYCYLFLFHSEKKSSNRIFFLNHCTQYLARMCYFM